MSGLPARDRSGGPSNKKRRREQTPPTTNKRKKAKDETKEPAGAAGDVVFAEATIDKVWAFITAIEAMKKVVHGGNKRATLTFSSEGILLEDRSPYAYTALFLNQAFFMGSYRCAGKFPFSADIHEVHRALKDLRQNYGVSSGGRIGFRATPDQLEFYGENKELDERVENPLLPHMVHDLGGAGDVPDVSLGWAGSKHSRAPLSPQFYSDAIQIATQRIAAPVSQSYNKGANLMRVQFNRRTEVLVLTGINRHGRSVYRKTMNLSDPSQAPIPSPPEQPEQEQQYVAEFPCGQLRAFLQTRVHVVTMYFARATQPMILSIHLDEASVPDAEQSYLRQWNYPVIPKKTTQEQCPI